MTVKRMLGVLALLAGLVMLGAFVLGYTDSAPIGVTGFLLFVCGWVALIQGSRE